MYSIILVKNRVLLMSWKWVIRLNQTFFIFCPKIGKKGEKSLAQRIFYAISAIALPKTETRVSGCTRSITNHYSQTGGTDCRPGWKEHSITLCILLLFHSGLNKTQKTYNFGKLHGFPQRLFLKYNVKNIYFCLWG